MIYVCWENLRDWVPTKWERGCEVVGTLPGTVPFSPSLLSLRAGWIYKVGDQRMCSLHSESCISEVQKRTTQVFDGQLQLIYISYI